METVELVEGEQYSENNDRREKWSMTNTLTVEAGNGSRMEGEGISVEYPLGSPRHTYSTGTAEVPYLSRYMTVSALLSNVAQLNTLYQQYFPRIKMQSRHNFVKMESPAVYFLSLHSSGSRSNFLLMTFLPSECDTAPQPRVP